MTTVGIRIRPLDLLFFRGGRPFEAAMRGDGGLPGPQQFAGLIRTVLLTSAGADFGAMRSARSLREAFRAAGAEWVASVRMRGPFLAEERNGHIRPVVAVPAHLEWEGTGWQPLLPLAPEIGLPGWSPPLERMRPLWRKHRTGKRKDAPAFLAWEGIEACLRGEAVSGAHGRRAGDLFVWEERTGLKIDPGRGVGVEGQIYGTISLRLREDKGVVFYGEVKLPDERVQHLKRPRLTHWGGERHLVELTVVEAVRWPSVEESDRAVWLAVAPGFPKDGAIPAAVRTSALRGAATRPWSVSGWDLARGGPKPTRFGIDAGSVFFTEGLPEGEITLTDGEEDAAIGYGFCLKGAWSYAR